MAVLEIRTFDDRLLRKSTKSIRKVTDELRQLARDMVETMHAAKGVGLAANQVGVPRRLIIVSLEEGPCAFVNPRVLKKSEEMICQDEGCLSFPRLYGTVARCATVRIAAYDLEMNLHKFDAEDFLARVFQHEIDHLNGVTFTERAEKGTLREVPLVEETEEEAAAPVDAAADETAQAAAGSAVAE